MGSSDSPPGKTNFVSTVKRNTPVIRKGGSGGEDPISAQNRGELVGPVQLPGGATGLGGPGGLGSDLGEAKNESGNRVSDPTRE